ncbi:hypothetical protein GCM10010394_48470 [Streptomyces crystallinus]|uniref:Transposase n=1 Tax=Streptomyces crystallinus TaxID=68191 RepID=A0ABN1GJJ2_9ACTN
MIQRKGPSRGVRPASAGNRNDRRAWAESGAKRAVGNTTTIADGGYPGTGLIMPHRWRKTEEPPEGTQASTAQGEAVKARERGQPSLALCSTGSSTRLLRCH